MDKAILYRWLWLYSASFLNGCMIWTDCAKRQRLKFECVVSKEERDLPLRVGGRCCRENICAARQRLWAAIWQQDFSIVMGGMVLGFNRFDL